MAIDSICNGCGKRLRVDDQYLGRQARCPVCGNVYTVTASMAETVGPSDGSQPSAATPNPSPDPPNASPNLAPVSGNPYLHSDPRVASLSYTFSAPADGTYWTRIPDGSTYGPADLPTVRRWIQEGRLNAACQVRLGDAGDWQPASSFFPELQPNYYATAPVTSYSNPAAPLGTGLQADHAIAVLVMGILSWVSSLLCCFLWFVSPVCAIIGVVIGYSDLKAMREGKMAAHARTTTQVGFYLCVAYLIVAVIGFIVWIAIAIAGGFS